MPWWMMERALKRKSFCSSEFFKLHAAPFCGFATGNFDRSGPPKKEESHEMAMTPTTADATK